MNQYFFLKIHQPATWIFLLHIKDKIPSMIQVTRKKVTRMKDKNNNVYTAINCDISNSNEASAGTGTVVY